MRILAVSDMHGQLQPVFDLVRRFSPELLVACGDWGDPVQQMRVLKDGRLAANVGQTADGEYILLQREDGEWSFEGFGTKAVPKHSRP